MAERRFRYRITAQDYLRRAQRMARRKDRSCLFYAALELRCGIEARMQEYLDPQDHVSDRKKSDWKIRNLAKAITDTFGIDDRIQRIAIRSMDGDDIAVLSYVPVSNRLQKIGEQLGNYLHAQQSHAKLTESWWTRFGELVSEGCQHLERAVGGDLYGPLLTNQKMHVAAPSPLKNRLKPGVKFKLLVRYEDL